MRFPRGRAHKLPQLDLYETAIPLSAEGRGAGGTDGLWDFFYISGFTTTFNYSGQIILDKQPRVGYRWLLDSIACIVTPDPSQGQSPAVITAVLSVNGIPVLTNSTHIVPNVNTQNFLAISGVALFQYTSPVPYYGGNIQVDAQCDFDSTTATHLELGLQAKLIVRGTAEPI